MNRIYGTIVLLALSGTSSPAQARPDSLRMSCAQAQNLVARNGAIVIGTGANIYDRYVLDHRFCWPGQFTKVTWIRTADTPQCLIGFRCIDYNPYFFD